MAENDNKNDAVVQEKKTNFKEDLQQKHYSRYQKKDQSEMTEDEKREEEEMRALNNGPTSDEKRGCTDILCCLFFLAFIGGCVVVTAIGFSKGDPESLTYFYDADGNKCGKAGTPTEEYPYLYFTKVNRLIFDYIKNPNMDVAAVFKDTICLKTCPFQQKDQTLDCYYDSKKTDRYIKNCEMKKEDIYLASPWLKRICLYNTTLYDEEIKNSKSNETIIQLQLEKTNVQALFNTGFINQDRLFDYLGDLVTVWEIILASVGFALVIGFIYLVVIRCCGCLIAYLCIFLILAVLIIVGWLFQDKMNYYESIKDETYKNIMMAFAIISYILAFIWFLIVLCSCNKIRLAIAITEVSARFVWSVMSIVLVPFFFFIVVSCYIAYWVALSVFIYSSGEQTKSSTTFITEYKWDENTRYAWWFHLFAGIYITAFFEALASFIYASTACIWYFEQGIYKEKNESVPRPICRSIWRAFRYHLGSLAFGALIIAIVRFIMVIVAYIRYQVENSGSKDNKVTKFFKCLLDCVLCCLACVEKCMEFINRHAYIMVKFLLRLH